MFLTQEVKCRASCVANLQPVVQGELGFAHDIGGQGHLMLGAHSDFGHGVWLRGLDSWISYILMEVVQHQKEPVDACQ